MQLSGSGAGPGASSNGEYGSDFFPDTSRPGDLGGRRDLSGPRRIDPAILAKRIRDAAAARARQIAYNTGGKDATPNAANQLFRQMERNNQNGVPDRTPSQQPRYDSSQSQPQYQGPGQYHYSGKSAEQMSSEDFAPQFAALAKMRTDAKKNYSKAGSQIGGMYAHLASAIRGDAPEVRAQYKQSGKDIGDAYNSAIKSTQGEHKSSNASNDNMAKRLGVEESVPAAQADGNNQSNLMTGTMRDNSANQQNLNTSLGQNEADYNRSEANISDAAGVNAKADFMQKLQLALQGIDTKGLSLKGEQGAARNKYGLDIQKLMQDGQQGLNSNYFDSLKLQADNTFRKGSADLDRDKFDETKRSNLFREAHPTGGADGNGIDPTDQTQAYNALQNNAVMEYGNAEAGVSASLIVQDAFAKGGAGGGSLQSFLNYLSGDYGGAPDSLAPEFGNRSDQQKLMKLATLFYNQVNNK